MDTAGELRRHAAAYGYNVVAFEKTVRLLGVMDALSAHPYLGDQFALKGGSALNLFLLDAPRLSVDLDLDFVGAPEREQMLADREPVEAALEDLVTAMGYRLRFQSRNYEGGKWRLNYKSVGGQSAALGDGQRRCSAGRACSRQGRDVGRSGEGGERRPGC